MLKYQIDYQHPSQLNLMMFNSIMNQQERADHQLLRTLEAVSSLPSTIETHEEHQDSRNGSYLPHQVFKKTL